MKDSNGLESDSDVSLEIPAGTVIAYSILELEIKKNGDFGGCFCVSYDAISGSSQRSLIIHIITLTLYVRSDICLQPGTIGGIESDAEVSWRIQDPMDMVDGKFNGINTMQNGLFGSNSWKTSVK